MAILIKNVDVEKRARELAALTGESLTGAIDKAIKLRLEQENAKPRKKATLAEMIEATDQFRKQIGLDDGRQIDTSKAAMDALNEIPGLEDNL
ncbi:type II toxin-antitoxin system VapB family antitoxin [Phenylobacterium sp.]|uniref:type II toxin-antitoxin system VapB family antitoxin n=1 Tax=Phenylobacterium sp. TaxID=1871053 RepID=UPI00271EF7B7|nr:type II toxin-antitoxin system VapB family antitoxin [Phenylobacterium sp.]MDO8380831.1 type II toxin-antitoxin system VapB family antitoxin [Phenylobacterium sp.]